MTPQEMCEKYGWLTLDQVEVANLAYVEGYLHAVETKWKPIKTCPFNTPVFVIENGHVQEFVAERFEDHWFEYGGDDFLDDFNPTHWTEIPTYG
jgi:hypothetical protein